MGREKLQETPLTPVFLIIGMDVGHLPSPTPINERDSSSEVDMIVEHLPPPPPYENAPRHRAQDVYGLYTPLRPYIIVLTHTKACFSD